MIPPDLELRNKVHERTGYTKQELNDFRLALAAAVVERFTMDEIRVQILANLERWERQGSWITAYDEWRVIACDASALRNTLLGTDEDAMRLRQSMPCVGLLSPNQTEAIRRNVVGDTGQTLALLQILELGNRQVTQGRVNPLADVATQFHAQQREARAGEASPAESLRSLREEVQAVAEGALQAPGLSAKDPQMTERRARAILGDDVFDKPARDATLMEMSGPAVYVGWHPSEPKCELEGVFTLEQLEAIVLRLRRER